MARTKESISISGKTLRARIPQREETINLVGNVGDAIVAYLNRDCFFGGNKFKTPSGEEICIPYVVGKVTEVRAERDCDGRLNPKYNFIAYIDMENGELYEIKGTTDHREDFMGTPMITWRICPLDKYFIPKINDYRAYTKYIHEREAAYDIFRAEWKAKDPMKLS